MNSLQLHQSLNLLFLLILGVTFSNVHLSWVNILAIIAFTLLIEHLFLYLRGHRPLYLSYASLTTAVGVIVLIYANALWIYFVIITLGLAQKHFLLIKGRHLFNPSNFALIVGLFFFYDDAHMIAGQFGDEFLFSMIVLVLALSILVRVGRFLIPFLFLFFYLLLQYVLIVHFDPVQTFQEIYHRFFSVTFMLFIYFMLTDPRVTPEAYTEQVVFIFLVVLVATLMDRYYGYRVQHLFMSLFFFSFWVHYRRFKKLSFQELKLLGTILCAMVLMLWVIQSQAPYYFEMNG